MPHLGREGRGVGRFCGHGQNIFPGKAERAIRNRIAPTPLRIAPEPYRRVPQSEELDVAEDAKHRSWQLLLQEAIREPDTSKLRKLIGELKKEVRKRGLKPISSERS
jgi:hypothetical protein